LRLAGDGFVEVGTEMLSDDVVMVIRRCATSQQSYVTIAHTAFHPCSATAARVRSVEVPGVIDEVALEASVVSWSEEYQDHDELIVGLSDYRVEMQTSVTVFDSKLVQVLHCKDHAAHRCKTFFAFFPLFKDVFQRFLNYKKTTTTTTPV